jgi:hypothetical protein
MDGSDEPAKISVAASVRFAYRTVFGRLGLVLELGWMPLLAVLVVLIAPAVLLPDRQSGDPFSTGGVVDYAEALVALLSLTAFAVRWHQSILVGDPHKLPPSLFFAGWLRFLAYGCIVYLLAGIVVALGAGLSQRLGMTETEVAFADLAALVVGLLLVLVLVRCGLLFPAAAAGKPLGPIAAWRAMRGNGWRIAGASLLATLPVTLVAGLLLAVVVTASLPDDFEPTAAPPLGLAILTGRIEAAADFLLVALGASLLSAFYRDLIERRGAGAFRLPAQR